jgi:hypothetical protein
MFVECQINEFFGIMILLGKYRSRDPRSPPLNTNFSLCVKGVARAASGGILCQELQIISLT